LQFCDKNGNRVELGSLYAGVPMANTLKDFSNVVLPNPVPLSTLDHLNVNYNDLLGNEYDVVWS
jgi:H+/gluconate symporter-like permease